MAVIVNGDGILTGISSLATALTDLTSGRGTITGVTTVGTLQLGAGVSISSPRTQNAAIFTNNTEFLTIDDAGRVGVGTITPNSDAHPENEKKINVGFITAKSIAGDIDARNVVVAGVGTFIGAASFSANVNLGDDDNLYLGASNDLRIYHAAGGASHINNTGLLVADGTTGVRLEYNNATRVDCTSTGVSLVGDVDVADKIIHTGDTNTAIRFPIADTVTIETGGSERFRVNSAGILFKSGQAALTSSSLNHSIQVAAASDANAIAIIGRAADDIGELSYYEADKSTKLGELQFRTNQLNLRHRAEGAQIQFATTPSGGSVTNRMHITSTGQVLIGADTVGSADGYSNNFMVAETSGSCGMSIQSYNSSSSYTTIALGDRTVHNRGYVEQRCGDNNQMTIGLNGNGSFRFLGKNSGGNTAERIRITYDGITFNGDTAAANALDDYEEGTYTAHFAVEAQGNMTMQGRVGRYVKVGQMVTVMGGGQVAENPPSGRSSSHAIEFSNLPFPAHATTSHNGHPFVVKMMTMDSTGLSNMNGSQPYQFIGRLYPDANYGRIEAISGSGTQDPQNASLALKYSTEIQYMFTYMTDA